MEPELEDQRTVIGEHPLEAVDLLDRAQQILGLGVPEHLVDDRIRVPGPEQDPDLAFGRQRAPIAPHRRSFGFLVRRIVEGVRVDVARIHPFVEEVDRLALARAAYARNEQDHWKLAELGKPELGVQQIDPQLRLDALVLPLGQLVSQLRRLEHGYLTL